MIQLLLMQVYSELLLCHSLHHNVVSTTSANVIPVSSTLSMTTTSDPSQISAIPSVTGVGATSNVVYYVPTQFVEPPSKVPCLDPEPQSQIGQKFGSQVQRSRSQRFRRFGM